MIETSIIIRTRNEEKWLGTVLEMLAGQTYRNFEIIVVDSGSTDRTLSIARKFPTEIYEIPFEDFNYPYALNFAIAQAHAEKYIVLLSAHSIPISSTWLSDGLENFRKFKNVA